LDNYDIENYGSAEFLSTSRNNYGEFRRVNAMIPFSFLDKTAKDFDWKIYGHTDTKSASDISNAFILNFDKFLSEGKGLYIYSSAKGSGKTLLSCCLLNEIVARHDINAKFINSLDYLELTKKSYTSQADKEEINAIEKSRMLIFDDLGVELSKEWTSTVLYRLINYRYNNKLITIITSNLPIEGLKVDDRIKDRLNSMCIPLHIPEVSVRTAESHARNEEFLKDVLSG